MIAARGLAPATYLVKCGNGRSQLLLRKPPTASFHITGRCSAEKRKKGADAAKKVIPKNAATPPPPPPLSKNMDPHAMASEMVRRAPDGRTAGTDAIASITPEQKMRNFALATGLLGFCTWVWWYSIQSVGKAEGSIEDLRAEAEDARVVAEQKSVTEKEAEELAQLDVTMSQLGDEIGEDGDDVMVAVAAPDDIAQEEEELNISAKKKGSATGGRPLWKKIVFFWRRE